ncbi:MAG: hypothetical protein KAY32_13550 [Candidatus Eisenbacteria sp.]|nr:hypothetical protein [Candidatus Eisenbacteria bacterium]
MVMFPLLAGGLINVLGFTPIFAGSSLLVASAYLPLRALRLAFPTPPVPIIPSTGRQLAGATVVRFSRQPTPGTAHQEPQGANESAPIGDRDNHEVKATMANKQSTIDQALSAARQVKHPAINQTLVDLGIARTMTVEGDTVHVFFALLFRVIPIRDQLIASISDLFDTAGIESRTET